MKKQWIIYCYDFNEYFAGTYTYEGVIYLATTNQMSEAKKYSSLKRATNILEKFKAYKLEVMELEEEAE
ncbi:hypothetical protein P0E66_10290 [Enterococcus faecalis]|uniref:hypothetical protein n=1 Tax=Enterococcus faecalis TaxID=1351 RepID=UPI0025B1A962|nr:hypothetical protein [Enterococcus faecalis]EKN1413215.1 hypothetical protein [Enterococcus faecalis]MDN3201512.1 hypothetical protein [Enterococcus faecalis]